MTQDLSRVLHRLTARMDREADALLQREAGLSYSRFLALYMVGLEGADTQRTLADRLGVSEPSVSRMVSVLNEAGWLSLQRRDGEGNRRRLELTATGEALVRRWGGTLEDRFTELVAEAGLGYDTYRAETIRLLAVLEAGER